MRNVKLFMLLLSFTLLTTCHMDTKKCTDSLCFNMDTFELIINNYLTQTTTGYVYAIYSEGALKRFGESGYAAIPKDGGVKLSSSQTFMNVASVGKSLTTIAVLQLLEKNNLTTQEKIVNWLPSFFVIGPNVEKITFENLLTQKSGFRPVSAGENFTEIMNEIRAGVELDNIGFEAYRNMNFCIFRILIPILSGDVDKDGNYTVAEFDQYTQFAYLSYMNDNVGGPYSATIWCDNPGEIRYYDFNDPDKSGLPLGFECQDAGGGAMQLTIIKLAQILYGARFTNDLLSTNMRAAMFNKSKPLGCYVGDETPVNNGVHYHHNGRFDINGQGAVACWYAYENDIVCVVAANSVGGIDPSPFRNIDDLMETAYDNAWE